jgi:hypothetical protein
LGALLVDVLKQFRSRHALVARNFFQVIPEGFFTTPITPASGNVMIPQCPTVKKPLVRAKG